MRAGIVRWVILVIVTAGGLSGGESMRIVPQLLWPKEGVRSANGAFWAAWTAKRVFLIGGKDVGVVRVEALEGARQAAFSADGSYLAACGDGGGFLLDLRSGAIRADELLRGRLIAFAPDSKTILTVRERQRVAGKDVGIGRGAGIGVGRGGGNYELQILDVALAPQQSFPIGMPHPESMTFSTDGGTALIQGFHGDPRMHVPRLGGADESVDLKTGVMKLNLGPVEGMGRPPVKSDELPPGDVARLIAHRVESFFRDEAEGLCAVYPGGGVKVWDVRGAFLASTLGHGEPFSPKGFCGRGTMLATTWLNDVNVLVRADARSGAVTALGYCAENASPSPDGMHVALAVEIIHPERLADRVEIRDEKGAVLFSDNDLSRATRGVWSAKGRYFLKLGHDRTFVRCFDSREKKALTFKAVDFFGPVPEAVQDKEMPVWSFAVDAEERLIAIGGGGTQYGAATVVRIADAKVVSRVEALPIWPQALQFVSPDELLVASRRGEVLLHSIRETKTVWKSATGLEVAQFGFERGAELLVCQDPFGGAAIVQMRDGAIVRRVASVTQSGSSDGTAWRHPQLIGDGTRALELDFDTGALRLVRTRTGETLLTYCALPEEQWIIFAPDGTWKGSERVGEFVRFYDGMRRLSISEAATSKSTLTGR